MKVLLRINILCGIPISGDRMSNVWLIVEAIFPNLRSRDIIRNFVKPVVDKFQESISTFHFFFEPHLLLRIRADKAMITDEIVPFVNQKLTDLGVNNPSVDVDPNYSEQADYGEGWNVAQKLFEFGSRSAILKAESDSGSIILGPQFNEGKFMHLILNQWGHSIEQEARIHLDRVGERLAMHYSQGNIDLLRRKLPHIVGELLVRYFPQIDEFVRSEITRL